MPDYKPVVLFDFAAGHMAETLTEAAVAVLRDHSRANAIQELMFKISSYLKNKSLIDADPKQMFPIFNEFVEIWPTDYFAMEKSLGKELARANIPFPERIPSITWAALDYLEKNKPLEDIAKRYKAELNAQITMLIGSTQDFHEIAIKWLHRAGASASDAIAQMARTKEKKEAEAKVAA